MDATSRLWLKCVSIQYSPCRRRRVVRNSEFVTPRSGKLCVCARARDSKMSRCHCEWIKWIDFNLGKQWYEYVYFKWILFNNINSKVTVPVPVLLCHSFFSFRFAHLFYEFKRRKNNINCIRWKWKRNENR